MAREIFTAKGVRDDNFYPYFCHIEKKGDEIQHIPGTVLVVNNGFRVKWLPRELNR